MGIHLLLICSADRICFPVKEEKADTQSAVYSEGKLLLIVSTVWIFPFAKSFPAPRLICHQLLSMEIATATNIWFNLLPAAFSNFAKCSPAKSWQRMEVPLSPFQDWFAPAAANGESIKVGQKTGGRAEGHGGSQQTFLWREKSGRHTTPIPHIPVLNDCTGYWQNCQASENPLILVNWVRSGLKSLVLLAP